MKVENTFKDSMFYEKNMKIKQNMWKVFTISLFLSLIVIFIESVA